MIENRKGIEYAENQTIDELKVPPHSIEAEQSVLGGLMLDNRAWDRIADRICEDDFYHTEHKLIFKIIASLIKKNIKADLITVEAKLKDLGELENMPSLSYIYELSNNTPSVANIEGYVDIVLKKSQLRQLLSFTENFEKEILKGNEPFELVQSKIEKLSLISQSFTKNLKLQEACLSYEQLLRADIIEREQILPWLFTGGLALVYSIRGLGKTMFALSLAYAVTSLDKFMCWQVMKNTGCLYVDGEMSLSEIRERLSGFATTTPDKQLEILSHEIFFNKFGKDLSITDKIIQNSILNLLDENKDIGLLIFDNLSCLSKIREDKSDDWREIMLPFLIACRRRGVAVLIVHHASKAGDQRGTGAREDALDVTISLTKKDKDISNNGACFRINFTKSRSIYGEDTKPFIANLVTKNNALNWEMTSIEQNTKQQMIELIAETGDDGISAKDLTIELGISAAMVSKYRRELEKESIIHASKGKVPLTIINPRI